MSIGALFTAGRAGDKVAAQAKRTRRDAATAFNEISGFYEPYSAPGADATRRLADLYGLNGQFAQGGAFENFRTSPGYEFRFNEGQRALEQGAAARGMLHSGNALTALTNYGQGMASEEYNRYLQGLMAMSGMGQNAANALNQSRMGVLQTTAQSRGMQGAAKANAALAQGAGISSLINLGMQAFGMAGGFPGISSSLSGLGSMFGGGSAAGMTGPMMLPGAQMGMSAMPSRDQLSQGSGGLY